MGAYLLQKRHRIKSTPQQRETSDFDEVGQLITARVLEFPGNSKRVTQTISWPLAIETVVKALAPVTITTLAGALLTRQGILTPKLCNALAKFSLNFLIPAMLFTKLLHCPSTRNPDTLLSYKSCPDISETMKTSWYLAMLPVIVVGGGCGVGMFLVRFFRCPEELQSTCVAAVSLGNSTGLPAVLLQVLTPSLKQAGVVNEDPLIFLSVYLIVYTPMQWILGRRFFSVPCKPTSYCASPVGASIMMCANNVLVPPVVASLAGLTIASQPAMHSLFVDVSEHSHPPFGFLYAVLCCIAAATVPVNLVVLGSNLSELEGLRAFPLHMSLGVAAAKLLVMPALIGSMVLLSAYVSGHHNNAQLLVAVIVSATPTANTLAVMTELSGSGKAGLSACFMIQYIMAPFTLTITLTCAIALLSVLGS